MLQSTCSSTSVQATSSIPPTPFLIQSFETLQFSPSDTSLTSLITETPNKRKKTSFLPGDLVNVSTGTCRQHRTNISPSDGQPLTELTVRELRALRRKEKSRLAAKVRRHQENSILSQLLNALPVALDLPPATPSTSSASSVNLEKSGVIRIAGQTLFIYKSFAHCEYFKYVLGTNTIPMVSLLSHATLGLLVQPSEHTVVYATPPLAEALSWPWINMIGASLEDILEPSSDSENRSLPTAAGQTIRLRILESTSPTKSSFHRINYENPSLWSPHLYRSMGAPQAQSPFAASASSSKLRLSLLCSCYGVVKIPTNLHSKNFESPQSIGPSLVNHDPTSEEEISPDPPNNHLMLYLLQPVTFPSAPLESTVESHFNCSPGFTYSPEGVISHRQQLKSNYPDTLQRQTISTSYPQVPILESFFTYLDSSFQVKSVYSSVNNCLNSSAMIGYSFLDLIYLDDAAQISSFICDCIQNCSELWSPAYRLRLPTEKCQLESDPSVSTLTWVRSLFSHTSSDQSKDTAIKCVHQPISSVIKSNATGDVYAVTQTILPTMTTNPGQKQQTASTRLHQQQSQLQQLPLLIQPHIKLNQRTATVKNTSPASGLIQNRLQPRFGSIRLLKLPQNSSQGSLKISATDTVSREIVDRDGVQSKEKEEKLNCTCPPPSLAQRWPIFTRTLTDTPEPNLLKREKTPPSLHLINSSRSVSIRNIKSPRLEASLNVGDSAQPGASLNEIMQSLGPDMLSLLDDQREEDQPPRDPNLNLSDILFPQSVSSVGGQKREDEEEESGLGSLSSSSPTSLISTGSELEMMKFNDSEAGLDPDILSDSDEFWDVLVSNVMNLPLGLENLEKEV